jgi:C4-dicarboxylate-specific signal transduction histidine kinase
MPNGNMYILESYSQQAHLTKNNYAFRDYYKGAVGTHDTYLGGVIISTASSKKEAVISVPIYSNNSNQLVGIWAGDIGLGAIEKSLQASLTSNNTTHNERVVFVDQNGKKIADSVKALSSKQNESFASLRSFKNAENGTEGSIVEQFNGTKMLITYQPVKLHSTTWTILLMRPANDLNTNR